MFNTVLKDSSVAATEESPSVAARRWIVERRRKRTAPVARPAYNDRDRPRR